MKNSFVCDTALDRITVDSGEPHVSIGQILAQKYETSVIEPLPRPMLVLLAQLEGVPGQTENEPGPSGHSATIVRCARCGASYERSTFRGFARERGSFECYDCGAELERWDTDVVPTFRIAMVPVSRGAPAPICSIW